MRVLLDANVIVAAFAARGLCADLVEYCLYEHTVLCSSDLIAEVTDALCRKVKVPPAHAAETAEFLKSVCELVTPVGIPEDVCRDRSDTHVLGAAVSGRADVIVTGDRDLLILNAFEGIRIATPRQFWEMMAS